MSIEVKAQDQTSLASVKAIYDSAEEANKLVSQADQSVFGTITYEYDNNGTIETVYKRDDGTYYYIDVNDVVVTVSESDLETDAEGIIVNRQSDGLNSIIEYAAEQVEIQKQYTEQLGSLVNDAQGSATSAYNSATNAQLQLSEVENILDVLTWITEHGEFILTDDTSPQGRKVYYELVNGQYVVVTDVASDPHAAGYYELLIHKSISNYVASHLSLTETGLYIQMDNSPYKLQIASDGIHLWNDTGVIASYTSSVTLGDVDAMHLVLSPGDSTQTPPVPAELGFYQGTTKVAWINMETLRITNAQITDTLRIGNFVWKPRSGRLSLMYSPIS